MPKRPQKAIGKFDPEFRFLVALDPALEDWRNWAAAYWASQTRTHSTMQTALSAFLVHYLHGQGLHLLPPSEFFAIGRALPEPDKALNLTTLSQNESKYKHAHVSDFLDWVLREQLAEVDADGHRVVPAHLRNPFPRRLEKRHGKNSDPEFSHVLTLDPKLDDWRKIATEWLSDQSMGVDQRRDALDKFLILYLYGHTLERNVGRFMLRKIPKPDFATTMVTRKVKGSQTLSRDDVNLNNYVAEFLDWVLETKLSDDDTGEWDRSRFHNPVPRLSKSGLAIATESNKPSLSIRYIKELRGLLAEGRHFRDWTWAQQAMETGRHGGDWFIVNPTIINPHDPDCVWREREASSYEMKEKGYPAQVVELWSPVRAVALYLKLELPLRTFQVCMLESGEADTWRYVHAPQGGYFTPNRTRLATGSEKRPHQRGVFHRTRNEAGAGLYINTNKTADIDKGEDQKGYVIPWAHEEALYWLEKLRNWQERYNPILTPTPWTALKAKHFGRTPPHTEVLMRRGAACFLFRDPTDGEGDKPLCTNALDILWYRLLAQLEKRCADRGETLNDGTPLRFVDPESRFTTYFPLHALRVSLISYLILDLNLPIAVVSKLIAGHARIIMTLHYTKFGKAYMREVMAEAEKNALEAEQTNHRRFLMDATFEQVGQRFASLSEDAVHAAIQNKSAAACVFEDKGICPVGGAKCDVGGNKINEWKSFTNYAPVIGYPQERNCVRCRFFLTGPAFLPGLQAHFNIISEKMHRQSQRYNRLEEQLRSLEKCRLDCERQGHPFLDANELERLAQREEAEAEAMGKLVNDMQATYYLILRSIEIARLSETDSVKLITTGNLSELKAAIIETQSELHQLEVVCESAVIYAETDAVYAVTRRSQILDIMLRYNGMEPVFMCLTPEQQLLAGNAVMKLIQARTGTLEVALDYAECRLKLRSLGVLSDELWSEIAQVTADTPTKELIDRTRKNQTLRLRKED